MRDFHIVIDQDDDREWVYKPTQYSNVLHIMAKMHPVQPWTFEREDYRVTVYPIALYQMPAGEELEEIEHRILVALNLLSD